MKNDDFKETLSKVYRDAPEASPFLFNKIWNRVKEKKVTAMDKICFSLSLATMVASLVIIGPNITSVKTPATKSSYFYYYEGSSSDNYSYYSN